MVKRVLQIGGQVIITTYGIIGFVQHLFGAVVIRIANPPFIKRFSKQVLSIIKLFRRLAKTYLFIRKIFICRKKKVFRRPVSARAGLSRLAPDTLYAFAINQFPTVFFLKARHGRGYYLSGCFLANPPEREIKSRKGGL